MGTNCRMPPWFEAETEEWLRLNQEAAARYKNRDFDFSDARQLNFGQPTVVPVSESVTVSVPSITDLMTYAIYWKTPTSAVPDFSELWS